jgi:hypothetical protein
MKKKDLLLILKDLQKVREILTPEQAAQVPNLFPKLTEEKEIKKGQRFNIDGQVLEAREDIKENKHKDPKNNKKWGKPTRKGGR